MEPASGGAMVLRPGTNLAKTRTARFPWWWGETPTPDEDGAFSVAVTGETPTPDEAAAVEGFGGGEDAGVRIGGDAAENAEEPPAGVAAEEEINDIAEEEGGDAGEEGVAEGEFAKGNEGAGG